MGPVPALSYWLCASSKSMQYLVAARVTLLSLSPQRGAHPKTTQPQADGTAGACPTLDIPLTGLQGETKGPFVPTSSTQEKPELKRHPKTLGVGG